MTPLQETMTFMKRWCAHPFRLGSLVPSSKALARFIASEALKELEPEDQVLELGAGTGRFTRALLEAGLSGNRLICMELDRKLAHYLTQQFPQARIVQGNAAFLENLIPTIFHKKVGVVISGLPMLSLPDVVQEKILHSCLALLRDRGKILQFTYSPFSSINAQRFGMEKKRLRWVWGNLPPANVWCYTRQLLWG